MRDIQTEFDDPPIAERAAPALAPTLGLMVGIVLDAYLRVPSLWHYVFAGAGAGQLWIGRRRPRARAAGLLLAGAACGMSLHAGTQRRVGADHVGLLCSGPPIVLRVRGELVQAPRIAPAPEGAFGFPGRGGFRTELLIRCQAAESAGEWIPLSGLLPLRIDGVIRDAEPGGRVEAFGRLVPEPSPTNPGQVDWARINRHRGVYGHLRCPHAEAVQVMGRDEGSEWLRAWRTRIGQLLLPETRPLDEASSSLVEAMVLGRRSRVAPALNQAFARTGTSHYLSASGLHVGILAGFVWLVATMFGVQRRGRAAIVLIVVALYAVTAEPRAPILRAAILAGLYCVSVFLHRSVHTPNWLAVSAAVILIWRPAELFSPGFQLSFIVLLGILYLTPLLVSVVRGLGARRRLEARLRAAPPPSRWRRLAVATGKAVGYSLAVSIAAWIAAVAPLAWHFHQFPPWGWLSSLMLMPLAFGVMVVGFVRIVAAAIWPMLGAWMGPVLDFLTAGLAGVVRWMATWPGATVWVPRPSVLLTIAAVGACVYALRLSRIRRVVRDRRALLWRLNAAVLVCVLIVTLLNPIPGGPQGLVMNVLDVGDGSATIIRLPDNRTLVYDAGSRTFADAGRSIVVPVLLDERAGRIDAVIISHANADHFNGVSSVADALPVRAAIVTEYSVAQQKDSSSARRLIEWLDGSEIPAYRLTSGDVLDLGRGVSCRVLWPPPIESGLRLSLNDSSLVLRFEYQGRSVLLCGDIETAAQAHLIERGGLGSDVLVLPHHGAVVANTAEFIAAVSPSVIVRSSGQRADGTYGALDALIGERAYYNTADVGAVRIRLHDGLADVAPIKGELRARH